jgi:hypothetical protein
MAYAAALKPHDAGFIGAVTSSKSARERFFQRRGNARPLRHLAAAVHCGNAAVGDAQAL